MRRSLVPLSILAGCLTLACAPDQPDRSATEPAITSDSAEAMTLDPPVAGVAGTAVTGLSALERNLFARGAGVFARPFTQETGLGPLFNSSSCANCHDNPVPGGYGDSVEVHMAAYHAGQSCGTLDAAGGPVVQQHATALLQALGFLKEPDIAGATATGFRSASPLFGLGLLEAVPDRTIRDLARIRYPDGVHGRAAILPDGRIGRFGRKATTASLTEFNAGAFFNEMGVTNPLNRKEGTLAGTPFAPGVDPARDPELSAADLAVADAFVHFLAPPLNTPMTPQRQRGEKLFSAVRCTSCHIPTLVTGFSPVRALSGKRIQAYTDILLHDMGPELADICNGVARPQDFRTQPLMGMQFLDMFMHDGLSKTVPEAIQRHGGEAAAARTRFFRLSAADQEALVAFVAGL